LGSLALLHPSLRSQIKIAGLLLLLGLAGCGSSHVNKSFPAPAVSIAASPTSISSGSSSTLTVAASNATSVTITGSDGSSFNLAGTGGSQVVSPTATTTYTAVAAGTAGSATANATVTVSTPSSPSPTVSMSASPTTIVSGSSSTLTITAANATQVTISGSDGSTYNLAAAGGKQVVSPKATTTYTATASGAGGKATATATVTVTTQNPAPAVTITATPASIIAGASSILTVSATNATQVIVTGSDGSSYTLTVTGGTQAVTPAATTTYTATATGSGGKASAQVTVTVTPNPPPTVQITANPPSITAGGSSTLTVTAVNATQLTLTGSDGSSYIVPSSGGTQAVSPSQTATYTATATGPGGTVSATATVTVTPNPAPTVTITANPATVVTGNPSTLTVTATNSTQVTVKGSDGSSYSLAATGGTQSVTPASTTTYTATATGAGGNASNSVTVTVKAPGSIQSIDHVIFMLQENRSFDSYFGMLNPYRHANGWNVGDDGVDYEVDGLKDYTANGTLDVDLTKTVSNQDDEGTSYSLFKFKTTCIDDDSSAWLSSYGDINRYDFLANRPIKMDGFVHTAEGFAKSCAASGNCSGQFTDTTGERAMGYYDQDFLNYYYYMASQFAVSDRWFSPMASKSVPNRLATFTGGTTQGLVNDPGSNDKLPQLDIPNIFQELDQAKVSWKIYYTVTQGYCLASDDCSGVGGSAYPAIHFSNLTYSFRYIYENPNQNACNPPTQPSSVVGDSSNSFCIDPTHIAPLSQYFTDLTNGTLPSFAFIEAGYGRNDEHPGSTQTILNGQAQVATIVNALMSSSEWKDSVFFFSYDEGGGPYDHVPPVPGHSNDNTDASLGTIPDISTIAVNPDSYNPCVPPGGTPTLHCDLNSSYPGANPGDAAATQGFAAQLGFRLPNFVISPFTRRHYVSHNPMDHTAIIKFVENRFIGPSAHLTARDAAQPNLLDFFDFNNVPWATPPTPPTPTADTSPTSCTAGSMGP
jgi:phospholipase C